MKFFTSNTLDEIYYLLLHEILKNPEAYEFYKKKYIDDEYGDKIKKQAEILKKEDWIPCYKVQKRLGLIPF